MKSFMNEIKTYMKDVINIIEHIAEKNAVKTIIDIGKLGLDMAFPLCSHE
jgi:hypothetical protein